MTNAKVGELTLIQVQEDGTICQLAMSPEQHLLLQTFAATISKSGAFYRCPKEFNLKLETTK